MTFPDFNRITIDPNKMGGKPCIREGITESKNIFDHYMDLTDPREDEM